MASRNRKKLAEFDAQSGDTRLMLTRDQIAETMRVFLPATSNEARLADSCGPMPGTWSNSA